MNNSKRLKDSTTLCVFRAAFVDFLEEEATKRLLVFVDGKDLGAVSGPAPCLALSHQARNMHHKEDSFYCQCNPCCPPLEAQHVACHGVQWCAEQFVE